MRAAKLSRAFLFVVSANFYAVGETSIEDLNIRSDRSRSATRRKALTLEPSRKAAARTRFKSSGETRTDELSILFFVLTFFILPSHVLLLIAF